MLEGAAQGVTASHRWRGRCDVRLVALGLVAGLIGCSPASEGGAVVRRTDSEASMTRSRDGAGPRPPARRVGPPGPLRLPGPREPSGAVGLPELGGLLVADDEPKAGPSQGLFFLRIEGQGLRHVPMLFAPGVTLNGNDWEGLAATPGEIVVLGSHSGRGARRARVCRFPRRALVRARGAVRLRGPVRCAGGRPQRRAVLAVLAKAARQHGFQLPSDLAARGPKGGGLNLEGLAYHRGRRTFLVGLRSPTARVGGRAMAILLRMDWTAKDPGFAFAGLVDLEARGVRGLTVLGDGSLRVIAGPSGKGRRFDLYRVTLPVKWPFRIAAPRKVTPAVLHRGTPRFRPEAVTHYGRDLFLFSDSGAWPSRSAHYLRLPGGAP